MLTSQEKIITGKLTLHSSSSPSDECPDSLLTGLLDRQLQYSHPISRTTTTGGNGWKCLATSLDNKSSHFVCLRTATLSMVVLRLGLAACLPASYRAA